jgi:hypothetical protein
MIENLLYISIGINIALGFTSFYAIKKLYEKQSTTNHIEDQTIKNKRNKNSQIDNEINSDIQDTKDKRQNKRRGLFNKKD